MKLYNTLTRNVDDFVPLDATQARIYSCGPTVYNQAQIGNLSAYIFADTLRRVVTHATGKPPKHVINYTDVDDKTIRRSREKYPQLEPREALRRLTDQYIALFLQDMKRIGNDTEAVHFVRATDHIQSMQELIRRLYEGGFAYVADEGVYFSIQAYQKSGKVYGQLLQINAQNTSQARIANDEYDKDSVHDFALWKKQKDDEPAWEFKLGDADLTGRPGWHIECSAMSRDELDQPFDIHTGGVDLIFPHHENEIAQSTALAIPTMAQFFAHNEHILIDGKKMSKSANNFYTLQDVTDKGFEPLAFRLLVLQAHYRSQMHFSWDNLEAAQNRLRSLRAVADLYWQPKDHSRTTINLFPQDTDAFASALQDDLDTPKALAALSATLTRVETEGLGHAMRQDFRTYLRMVENTLGIKLLGSDISEDQQQLIREREEAREAKEWSKSDGIRDILIEQRIGLRDTDQGTVWYRL